MVLDLSKITGLDDFTSKTETKSGKPAQKRTIYYKGEKAFLVENTHTIEIRCDEKLSQHLMSKYESVMQSRYFGRGGIEIVPAGQLSTSELADLIRLSYNLTV